MSNLTPDTERTMHVVKDVTRSIRHPKKRKFLSAFSVSGNVTLASEAAGCDRSTHYVWLREDQAYREAFERARELAGDLLEAEARRRAVQGVTEPVLYAGRQVLDAEGRPVFRRVYSDYLMAILLRGAKPEVYGQHVQISGPAGGPVIVEHRLETLAEKLRQAKRLPEAIEVEAIEA